LQPRVLGLRSNGHTTRHPEYGKMTEIAPKYFREAKASLFDFATYYMDEKRKQTHDTPGN
jgi:hypothetical protein